MIIKFIHQITALFLTFVLLANNINNVVIVTDFVINQDFIARTLCIQKEEQKGCNGKCYLKNQLEEASNQDQNQPLQLQNTTKLSCFILTDKALSINTKSTFIHQKKNLFFFKQDLIPIQFVFEIIHPPEILV